MKNFSKSQFIRGTQCLKSLWLYRHQRDLKEDMDPFHKKIAKSGTEFGVLARDRFPGGVLIKADHNHPEDALAETTAALKAGAHTLYEAAFLHDDVLVRVDIMQLIGPPTGPSAWALYEVKSGTGLEPVHIEDVAIQRFVLAGAGFDVKVAHVVHANSAYTRMGALDLDQLFMVTDVTLESANAMADVPARLKEMKGVDAQPKEPAVPIGSHCSKPYDCDFRGHCWKDVPEYSVFNLGYAKMPQKLKLYNSGVVHIKDIDPKAIKLTEGQRTQVDLAKSGKPRIDKHAIQKFLDSLVYPIAHLDFETDNPVVPPYDGLRPYSQMPFQASLRVQTKPGGKLMEFGYLGDGQHDPREGLARFLYEYVPPSGSVLAYHMSFEGGRLTELSQWYQFKKLTSMAQVLANIGARLQDLADPFRTGMYAHPDFKGRWSIKAVLPVLVPTMSYDDLVIKDGMQAMEAYARLRDITLHPEERQRLTEGLKVYCGQDTQGMVEILAHLYDVVAGKVEA